VTSASIAIFSVPPLRSPDAEADPEASVSPLSLLHAAATMAKTATRATTLSIRFNGTPSLVVRANPSCGGASFPCSLIRALLPGRNRPFRYPVRSRRGPRIEGIAKSVADEVEREGRREQRDTGEQHQPRRVLEGGCRLRQHGPPRRRGVWPGSISPAMSCLMSAIGRSGARAAGARGAAGAEAASRGRQRDVATARGAAMSSIHTIACRRPGRADTRTCLSGIAVTAAAG